MPYWAPCLLLSLAPLLHAWLVTRRRRRFKPGEMSRPHYHDKDRLVTMIKGTWFTGEGDIFDAAKTTPIKTGGFMLHPAGMHHYDGAQDQEVIVQIIGMGPVQTTNTEVKP